MDLAAVVFSSGVQVYGYDTDKGMIDQDGNEVTVPPHLFTLGRLLVYDYMTMSVFSLLTTQQSLARACLPWIELVKPTSGPLRGAWQR